jgi:hypothetical protein
MHANREYPNILQDMRAALNVPLRNPLSKRNLIPPKDYRHCANAQIIGVDIRRDPVNPA